MQVEIASERIQTVPWMAQGPFADSSVEDFCASQATTNLRAVGYIAKPEEVNKLTGCIKGRLINILREIPGFNGAVILHSHKEWRRVMVLTFWKTETQATQTCWEDFSAVCELIYPLVDVCTRVQTFRGSLAGPRSEAAAA